MDYNIYIRTVSTVVNESKPTVPNPPNEPQPIDKPKPTTPQGVEFFSTSKNFVSKVKTFASSGAGGVISKVVPGFAIMYAIYKIVDKVAEVHSVFYTAQTGDYYTQEGFNYYRNEIRWLTNPITTAIAVAKADISRRVANKTAETNRILTGDTLAIYNYGARGKRV